MDPNLSGTLHNQRRVAGSMGVCQGVLNPAFTGTAVYTTMSVSPIAMSTVSMSRPLLSSLGITAASATGGATTPPAQPLLITDVTAATVAAAHHSDKDDSACGGSSSGSVSSTDDRKTPAANRRKRGEVYV
ncbi:uncharacterized protein LOC113561071 [Rhopalosiphum maidis]|nr:uncharacterized protein LOC113561071 [Rhopalosiphum maidis]